MSKSSDYSRKLRASVLDKYGHTCACCGVKDFEFLTINHINQDGAAHRRSLSKGHTRGTNDKVSYSGSSHGKMYRELRDSPRRADINLLCWNCNSASYFYGTCPHRVADSA